MEENVTKSSKKVTKTIEEIPTLKTLSNMLIKSIVNPCVKINKILSFKKRENFIQDTPVHVLC